RGPQWERKACSGRRPTRLPRPARRVYQPLDFAPARKRVFWLLAPEAGGGGPRDACPSATTRSSTSLEEELRPVDRVPVADAPEPAVEVHARLRQRIDALDRIELQRFRRVRRLVELQVLIPLSLARLLLHEFPVAHLVHGDAADGTEVHIGAVHPLIEVVAVVLNPDLLHHARVGVAECDVVLDAHHLILTVALRVEDVVALR